MAHHVDHAVGEGGLGALVLAGEVLLFAIDEESPHHGRAKELQMISADTDFARFTALSWYNPVAR